MLYLYDTALKQTSGRWRALQVCLATIVLAILAVANHPLGWIISHLTFDPVSGYFRMLIWDAATQKIMYSPLTGYAFALLNHDILDTTIDSVWLVFALRFGLPMIFLLILTNIASILPVKTLQGRHGGSQRVGPAHRIHRRGRHAHVYRADGPLLELPLDLLGSMHRHQGIAAGVRDVSGLARSSGRTRRRAETRLAAWQPVSLEPITASSAAR